jgi:hypothetical protein
MVLTCCPPGLTILDMAGKVKLAWEVRQRTSMPLAWIAQRLRMGSRGSLTWLLYSRGKIKTW